MLDYKVGSRKGQEADDDLSEKNDKKKQKNKAKTQEKQGEGKAKEFDVPKEKNGRKTISWFMCGGNHNANKCPLKHHSVNVVEKMGHPLEGIM